MYARKAKKSRKNTESKFEIAIEESRLSKHEDYEIGLSEEVEESGSDSAQRKLFRNIFPDEITIRGGVQFGALTHHQAKLLKAYFDSDETLPLYKRWEYIGKKINCSGKTVAREFRALVEKFLKTTERAGHGSAIEEVRVRGERRPRYYRKHLIQIGEWRQEWSELITDKKTSGSSSEVAKGSPGLIRPGSDLARSTTSLERSSGILQVICRQGMCARTA